MLNSKPALRTVIKINPLNRTQKGLGPEAPGVFEVEVRVGLKMGGLLESL